MSSHRALPPSLVFWAAGGRLDLGHAVTLSLLPDLDQGCSGGNAVSVLHGGGGVQRMRCHSERVSNSRRPHNDIHDEMFAGLASLSAHTLTHTRVINVRHRRMTRLVRCWGNGHVAGETRSPVDSLALRERRR